MVPIFIICLMITVALIAIKCASSDTVTVSPIRTSRLTAAAGLLKPCAIDSGAVLRLRMCFSRPSRASFPPRFLLAFLLRARRPRFSSSASELSSAARATLDVVMW